MTYMACSGDSSGDALITRQFAAAPFMWTSCDLLASAVSDIDRIARAPCDAQTIKQPLDTFAAAATRHAAQSEHRVYARCLRDMCAA